MSKPKLLFMVGLPASGKSTVVEQLRDVHDANVHASDKIREELTNDVRNQNLNGGVFDLLHKRVKADLKKGINVIYDATNISWKRRKAFLDELNIDCEKICILVATPYKDCLKRNAERNYDVPEEVMKKMYMNFYVPQYYEGWDDIQIVWNFDKNKFDMNDLIARLRTIDQDCPHHTKSVGGHCIACAAHIRTDDLNLFEAALYHDIGKEFTKNYLDKKGKSSKFAHYYQHHLVSAYDSLFYSENPIEVAKFITWHMQPYFLQDEHAIDKFIRLVGMETYQKLLILHQADILAQ